MKIHLDVTGQGATMPWCQSKQTPVLLIAGAFPKAYLTSTRSVDRAVSECHLFSHVMQSLVSASLIQMTSCLADLAAMYSQ